MSEFDSYLEALSAEDSRTAPRFSKRRPVHVFYGGADRFSHEIPSKLGRIATEILENNSSSFADFARAVWLPGADSLPENSEPIQALEFKLADAPSSVQRSSPNAWLAWEVHRRVLEKLRSEPVEDYRVDFEDGYGFRSDEEEDSHCVWAAGELARLWSGDSSAAKPRMGFRVKSFQEETRKRALRTLKMFLNTLLEHTEGRLEEELIVVLPKVTRPVEVEVLGRFLEDFEERSGLEKNSIGVEFLAETPVILECLDDAAAAVADRLDSVHFGAYDYTSALGIASSHQHLKHRSCDFARNEMLRVLSPLGIPLSDSVTTEMPIPVHRGTDLSLSELAENKLGIRNAWRRHFGNVTYSMINGFYRSWDLHPGQLPARYAAVYSFFLESADEQAKRLSGFFEKATQAMTTGNVFDDAASAEGIMNYFRQGVSCGAFEKDEVLENTGLTNDEFEMSFSAVMESRRSV